MNKTAYIFVLFLLTFTSIFSQDFQNEEVFEIKGSVKGKENMLPISEVEVSTTTGRYTTTNGLGEFKIKVVVGDELIFRSPDLETVRYTVRDDEDVTVLVQDYVPSSVSRSRASMHQTFLDSANYYKKDDIGKSIDFITESIAQLGKTTLL